MFTFWICTRVLQWSCLKAVSVSTFVLGGLRMRGSTATSDLVLLFIYMYDKKHVANVWTYLVKITVLTMKKEFSNLQRHHLVELSDD